MGVARLEGTNQLTHRLLMGERKGFGRRRWSRTIQGAYRSISPAAYSPSESQQTEDAIITHLQLLRDQLQLLGPYTIYTDGGWEYGGDGMDAPFHPYTDSPSHKGGGSIIFLTTDLRRIKDNMLSSTDQDSKTIDHVAIRIDHGEVVGRGPNPQELLALLGALAVNTRLETMQQADKRIGSDCKSLVDYVNAHRHTRMRNEVGKLPFLLAIQQYLQRDDAQQVRWVQSHPERGKTDKQEFDLDEWGIYIADCYASNKKRPAGIHGQSFAVTAEQLVRNVFLRQSWFLGTTNGIPLMVDPKRRYQDHCMLDYWKARDGQENHAEVYQGSSTYMMQQVGNLRYCSMRQRARKVKLMLDWGVHGRRMKLMGLEESGRCPICMDEDSLAHIAFDCHYSAATHKRQTWIAGLQDMIQQHRRRGSPKT